MGTYRLRVPASRVGYVPDAQGGLSQGPTHCTYWVRVPASGVGYVPRTVAPLGEGQHCPLFNTPGEGGYTLAMGRSTLNSWIRVNVRVRIWVGLD